MSFNKVITLCMGILLITGLFFGAVVFRPVWMKSRDTLNSTVYRFNEDRSTTAWVRLRNTMDSSFWLIPAVGVIIIVAWIYMTMQEKEYVGGGYYH